MRRNLLIGAALLVGAAVFGSSMLSGTGQNYRCDRCNVVYISIEPWNARHAGFNGYPENITPNIDRLAERSYVFENAYTTNTNTVVSIFSSFTGLYPGQHGITTRNVQEKGDNRGFRMLAEVFDDAGYRTVALASGSNMRGRIGINRGFDRYLEYNVEGGELSDISFSEFSFRDMVEEDRPVFFYYQSFAPHMPYMVEDPQNISRSQRRYRQEISRIKSSVSGQSERERELAVKRRYISEFNRSTIIDAYDRTIREQDERVGKMIEAFRKEGELDETVFVITSQHGEMLGRKSIWGHETMYEGAVRVPMVVHIPDAGSRRTQRYIQSIDIAPGVLDITGIPHAEFQNQSAGVSLVKILAGEIRRKFVYVGIGGDAFIDTRKEIKYIPRRNRTGEFYNLSGDPLERNPLELTRATREVRSDYRDLRQRIGGDLDYGSSMPYYVQ